MNAAPLPPEPAAPAPTPAKPFYQSTAFWFNALSLAVLAAAALLDAGAVDGRLGAILAAVVAVGNVLIRRYATTGPMVFGTPPDAPAPTEPPNPLWVLPIDIMRELVRLYDAEQSRLSEGGEDNPNG